MEQKDVFEVVAGQDGEGQPIFSVLVKRTYDISPGRQTQRAERARPLVKMDVYYENGDPQWSTVQYETDLVPFKPATDVVVIGKAYAPQGKPTCQMNVGIEVAGRCKVIYVIGDRYCSYRRRLTPLLTDPDPFTEMEIRYDRAYGGTDNKSNPDLPFAYPRNTMGTGVAIANEPASLDGLALPNIEEPDDLLTPERIVLGEPRRWNDQPLPTGCGWFQRTWYPRCSFVGSMPGFVDTDTVLREEKLGMVPKGQVALARQFKLPSFDVRFNNGASRGLVFPYLKGTEFLRLTGLTREGQLEFTLPAEKPSIMLNISLGENQLKPVLHTVCVRVEDMQVDLVWCGVHQYPGQDWLPEMKIMHAEVH